MKGYNLINFSCFLRDENKIWRKALTIDLNAFSMDQHNTP